MVGLHRFSIGGGGVGLIYVSDMRIRELLISDDISPKAERVRQ